VKRYRLQKTNIFVRLCTLTPSPNADLRTNFQPPKNDCMLKRTKGIFLLILLVLTGFAGRISSDTISRQERRFLIEHLKIPRLIY
jgi:hypothetical protein